MFVTVKPSHFFLNAYTKLNAINLKIDCGDQNKAISLKSLLSLRSIIKPMNIISSICK